MAILPLFTLSWSITVHGIAFLLTSTLRLFPHTLVINNLSGRGEPANGALLCNNLACFSEETGKRAVKVCDRRREHIKRLERGLMGGEDLESGRCINAGAFMLSFETSQLSLQNMDAEPALKQIIFSVHFNSLFLSSSLYFLSLFCIYTVCSSAVKLMYTNTMSRFILCVTTVQQATDHLQLNRFTCGSFQVKPQSCTVVCRAAPMGSGEVSTFLRGCFVMESVKEGRGIRIHFPIKTRCMSRQEDLSTLL